MNLKALTEFYNEPHRYYHNLDHISKMLVDLYAFQSGTITLAQQIAIWFHDALYDPKAKDNEEQSVRLMWKLCSDMDISVLSSAETMILLSKHDALCGNMFEDGVLLRSKQKIANFLDADLAGLGKSRLHYVQNLMRIRLEFSHINASDFETGRKAWIRQMLNRSRIFYTNRRVPGTNPSKWFEESARANLEAELDFDAEFLSLLTQSYASLTAHYPLPIKDGAEYQVARLFVP